MHGRYMTFESIAKLAVSANFGLLSIISMARCNSRNTNRVVRLVEPLPCVNPVPSDDNRYLLRMNGDDDHDLRS